MNEIEDYVNRPRRYLKIDGVDEIVFGVIGLAIAATLWLIDTMPRDSLWHREAGILWLLAMVLGYFGAEALRGRITYRRTGFVELRRTWWNRLFINIIAGAVAYAVVVFGLTKGSARHLALFNVPVVFGVVGILFAAAYGVKNARQAPWKWAIALVIGGGSLAICLYPGSLLETELRWFALFGVSFLVSGSITFYLYLRHTQPAARTAE